LILRNLQGGLLGKKLLYVGVLVLVVPPKRKGLLETVTVNGFLGHRNSDVSRGLGQRL